MSEGGRGWSTMVSKYGGKDGLARLRWHMKSLSSITSVMAKLRCQPWRPRMWWVGRHRYCQEQYRTSSLPEERNTIITGGRRQHETIRLNYEVKSEDTTTVLAFTSPSITPPSLNSNPTPVSPQEEPKNPPYYSRI